MLTNAILVLLVFYMGAVLASGRAWRCVQRGSIGFSALRDVTGINDRGTLGRHFGPAAADGVYKVSFADVLRHRRAAGVILTDLPVHLLFLAALTGAAYLEPGPVAAGIATAAAAHAVVVGLAALSVFMRGVQAQLD